MIHDHDAVRRLLFPGQPAPTYHVQMERGQVFPFDRTQPADYVVSGDGVSMRIPYMGMLMTVPVVSCPLRGLARTSFWSEGKVGAHVPEERCRTAQPFAPRYFVLDGREELPPPNPQRLYDYLIAGNGVFLRTLRRGVEVVMQISPHCDLVGLHPMQPHVRFPYPRISQDVVRSLFQRSREQTRDGKVYDEILFYLLWRDEHWQIMEPEQQQSRYAVHAVDKGLAARLGVLVEVHSHHTMPAYFSRDDDGDEKWTGIYCVLGNIAKQPELRMRVVVDSYLWDPCPPTLLFDMPGEVTPIETNVERRTKRWE